MFYDNLKKACKNNNTTPSALVKSMKISSANVTNWKDGTSPRGDVVVRLSEILNVSCDYLLTGKEKHSSLNIVEQEIVQNYRKCNQKGKNYILESTKLALMSYKNIL